MNILGYSITTYWNEQYGLIVTDKYGYKHFLPIAITQVTVKNTVIAYRLIVAKFMIEWAGI